MAAWRRKGVAQALFVAGMVLREKGKFGDTPTTEMEQPAGNSITSQPLVLQQTPAYSHSIFCATRQRKLGILRVVEVALCPFMRGRGGWLWLPCEFSCRVDPV